MVADLAAITGKRIAPLKVSGSELTVNVRALDRLGDAVVHMLRNAVAHGVEPPEVRAERGKPESGRVELSLGRSGDELVIEVADDGAGIDRDEVVRRAESAGVIRPGEADGMSPEQVDALVLRPGLTTLAEGGDGGGRGVGMDTVAAAAEFLEGRVEVENTPGAGLRVRLVVPDPAPA
jgi:chemotaxis protein histidine kinase CheA